MSAIGAIAIAALLAAGGPDREVRLAQGLEQKLALELQRRDAAAAARSSRQCTAALRQLTRALRSRGAAAEALGDGLRREDGLARSALAERRWTDALAATRATQAVLDEAGRLR